MIEIVVTPLGCKSLGRFEVRLDGRIILKSSRQPLLEAARFVIAGGVVPETCIVMRHEGSPHVALGSTVGKATKLTVAERDNGNGPVFEQWKPHPSSAVPSPTRLGEGETPDIAPDLTALHGDEVTA